MQAIDHVGTFISVILPYLIWAVSVIIYTLHDIIVGWFWSDRH